MCGSAVSSSVARTSLFNVLGWPSGLLRAESSRPIQFVGDPASDDRPIANLKMAG